MKLRVIIEGRPVDLELNRNGEACHFSLRSGDDQPEERTASLAEVSPAVYSVLLGGRSYEVRVEPAQGRSFVAVQGRRFAVEVEDPRRSRRKAAGVLGEGRQSVTAPMPGKVVRLLVSAGDRVEAGQGLLVVEAMKMQNEMKAPKAGVVAALSVREGDAVAAGEVLAAIE
jgi:biotin carboxyl carrier protein